MRILQYANVNKLEFWSSKASQTLLPSPLSSIQPSPPVGSPSGASLMPFFDAGAKVTRYHLRKAQTEDSSDLCHAVQTQLTLLALFGIDLRHRLCFKRREVVWAEHNARKAFFDPMPRWRPAGYSPVCCVILSAPETPEHLAAGHSGGGSSCWGADRSATCM